MTPEEEKALWAYDAMFRKLVAIINDTENDDGTVNYEACGRVRKFDLKRLIDLQNAAEGIVNVRIRGFEP